jgi:hypothetical protein
MLCNAQYNLRWSILLKDYHILPRRSLAGRPHQPVDGGDYAGLREAMRSTTAGLNR